MSESFYTSDFDDDDTSTTIIFNLFKGDPKTLELQLRAATSQQNVQPPAIRVMCFNSPRRREFEAVVDRFRANYSNLSLTVSDFNYKFHGRFLLAYMATTKYVLVVDDDKNLDATTVSDYIQYMKRQPGVWGNNGHLRAATFDGYKSWPSVGYDLNKVDMAEQDYLCGMWFLEQRWLEYFVKERVPSWETAEDMHLSHVMRKYLNLNTYGGKVAMRAAGLPGKAYTATKGTALDLREFIFDHQLGRGNKVADVDQPIQSLLYAETVEDIARFSAALQRCPPVDVGRRLGESEPSDATLCSFVGKTAVLFRGGSDQDVPGMIAAAQELCNRTECAYYSVKPRIQHEIRLFNMREAFGQRDAEIPWQTRAADVLMSSVGVLNNVLPTNVFLPAASAAMSSAPGGQENQRLMYNSVLRLALDVHRNTQINRKSHDRELAPDASVFPTGLNTFLWRSDRDGDRFERLVPPYAIASG